NKKARWLGMTNTHFTNPHGLDDKEHYSTAYDMAILMRYAMQNDTFKKITGTKSHKAEKRVYSWRNKNKLLTSYYKYCVGGKTGFTKKSGRTLVTAAKKDDMELIAVTLNAGDDWREHMALFDWGFKEYTMKKVVTKGKHQYKTADMAEPIAGMIKEDIHMPLMKNDKVTKETFINEQAIEERRPVIGMITYYINDIQQQVVPIYIPADMHQKEGSFFQLLNKSFKHMIGIESG